MQVLFLLGSIQAFFFATLFWNKKKIIYSHKVLIVFFILNGLILLDHYLESNEIVFEFPHLLGITYTLPIILGPIIFYYTLILINKKKSILRRFIVIHSIPFVFLTSYFLFDYYFLSAEEKLNYYYQESEIQTSIVVYITEFFLIFSVPIYSILSIFKLHKHKKDVKNKFSYTEEVSLKWLRVILYFFSVLSVVALITNLLSDVIPVFSFLVGDNITFASLTVVIFFIGYFGIKQKAIYTELHIQPHEKKNQYQKSGLKVLKDDQNIKYLLDIMEKEKPYLNSKLSLRSLADRMNFTENNLSQLINDGLNKNFYDFINEYRIQEVKHRILDQSYAHLSLLGIAYDSGFNSKSSFNYIFKKYTNMTPSQYRKINS